MLIKSFTHEIASREEFHMVKITEQVKKDVEESGVEKWSRFCHFASYHYRNYD